MNYQPFLIAYAQTDTGIDRAVQPWLIPNDAFTDLLDGYVYRGVVNKRDGYDGYATGERSIPTESRMVHRITAESYGSGSGIAGPYLHTAANLPVRRGTITITAGAQSATDNGNGTFVTSPAGGTGTINYTTGQMSVTFNAVVPGATPITVTYDYFQGLPVMGIMTFFPSNTQIISVPQLIVADTRYVNRYNPSTDRLDDISNGTYTGGKADFWSSVNYPDASSNPRLLFCNGVVGDVIQQYDGASVSNYAPTFTGGTLNARQMFYVRGRLVLFQTIQNGTLFPRRIRISGFGSNCDVFDSTAPGAGFIDIPDNTWYFGAASNRDDIMFFMESSTWLLKYTGNDVRPFTLQKLDGSRGSGGAFIPISYLNRTLTASPRGLIISEGYSVERMDDNIPDFTFNTIDNTNFIQCFSGFVDEDRDVYLLYPSQNQIRPTSVPGGSSDEILVINFEEDNFAQYRIPMSCMGTFQEAYTITWADLTAENGYPTWEALGAKFDSWAAFPFSKGTPVALGGGHKGEIWKLNSTQGQDNPLHVRDIQIVDSNTVRVTTDWNNYSVGDYISFTGVEGMTQINGKQGAVKPTPSDFYTFDVELPTEGFDAYTEGGMAFKTIPFECIGKKLNPYLDSDRKVRCGWMYFYVSVADTSLTDSLGEPVPAFLTVDVIVGNNDAPDFSNPTFTYQVDCSPINEERGGKKWVKIWINQVGQFLQFKMSNNQAGCKVQVHAVMCGFMPVGRLI